tara:strand:- start:2526 stop:3020 length:495 start_codon:yes stop_codon:yes gene_type:complete
MPPKKKAKCFTRYNSSGNPYTICADKEWSESDRKNKGPQVYKDYITPEQFIDKLGKSGYTDLTQGQRKEYHRLDMGIRRRALRYDINKVGKDINKLKKELTQKSVANIEKQKLYLEEKYKKENDEAVVSVGGQKIEVKNGKAILPTKYTKGLKKSDKKVSIAFD